MGKILTDLNSDYFTLKIHHGGTFVCSPNRLYLIT
ncbi:hypothetical protein CsSME_00012670 [Camellia sinensis var. sinensis]